jgi:uncharacterized protein YceH (UPF0502 family)
MTEPSTRTADAEKFTLAELSHRQLRVLGVLIEKGLTTPDAYPLTLKATTTGCNQKSNRDPVTNYTEDDVQEVLDQLRELGLVGELHTDSGRAARYRHYLRHKLTITEPQIAILGELLLRGRQRLGELRTRAGRMVPIDSLEQLREELEGMIRMGWVQSSGDLERRGTLVDHDLYRPNEGGKLEPTTDLDDDPPRTAPTVATLPGITSTAPPTSAAAAEKLADRLESLEAAIKTLRGENTELRLELDSVRDEMRRLTDAFEKLRVDLGG